MSRLQGPGSIALLAAVLILAAGCASESEVGGAEETEMGWVEHAAMIGLEIEADPDATEEILERHGIDADEFEEMLLEISKDEELRKAYNARLGD